MRFSGSADVARSVVDAKRHMNWVLKALLPIAAVLINGLLLFVLVSSSLDPDRVTTSSLSPPAVPS